MRSGNRYKYFRLKKLLENYKISDVDKIGLELNYLSNNQTSNKINEIINRENNKMIIIAGHTYKIDNLIKLLHNT